jgi:hypothetical protein
MAVLSNIRQRSALIAVIAFALFAFIIGDLFSSGGLVLKRCRKHQWQGYLI